MHRLRCAVVVLALAFVACGGGGDGDTVAKDPAAALRAAAGKTEGSRSVKMSLTVGSGKTPIASGEGAFDFPNKLGRFKLSSSLGVNFDFIITPDKVYLKNPQSGAGRKPWIAVNPEDAAGSPSLGFLTQLRSQIDPRETLKNLGTTVKDVKKIGNEKIRGTATTHLRGQVDLSEEAIAKAPVEARDSLREAQKQFGEDGYAVDVWLDDEGRVRRFEYAMGGALPTGGESKITMDLYGYGEDPKIELPKAEDVEEETFTPPTTAA